MIQKETGLTEKLYETDGHCLQFEAAVLSCTLRADGKYDTELDRTAFFPRGGGQECDVGMLGDCRVAEVASKGEHIFHVTEGALPVGARVCGRVDGAVRFPRMQNHSGEHILSGLVWQSRKLDNVGFHLGEGYVTLDFNGVLSDEELSELERRANEIIWENRPITARYPSPEELEALVYRSKLDLKEDVRIVTVEGVDTCACCAPHCAATGEIGLLKITDHIHYKGGVRLWIACGAWALADYRVKQDNVLALSRTFSVKPPETAAAVAHFREELLSAKAEIGALQTRLGEALLATAEPDGAGNLLFFPAELDGKTQRTMAQGGAAKCPGICAVFCAGDEGFRFVAASERVPLKAVAQKLRTLGGRCGGGDSLLQGTVATDEATLRRFFDTCGTD